MRKYFNSLISLREDKLTMDISAATIVLTLVWGVAIGCVYILLATGLNIIFGVMKLVNFAHGQLLMIGDRKSVV